MYDHFVSSSLSNRAERGRKLKLAQIRLITRALLLYVVETRAVGRYGYLKWWGKHNRPIQHTWGGGGPAHMCCPCPPVPTPTVLAVLVFLQCTYQLTDFVEFVNNQFFCFFPLSLWKFIKVLSLLEACFDLISPSSLSMKIQIIGGKITENLGFKSPLRKVKFFCPFFLFILKFSIKNCISLILRLYLYL